MTWVFYNPNPQNKLVGDCVIRAIAKLTDKTWEDAYMDVTLQGYMMKDMPSSNHVWGTYLRENGFIQHIIPDSCPDCYTVQDFCNEHPVGKYLLAIGSHVVAVQDGNYFDTWDSGDELPIYYWQKGDMNGVQ